MSVIALVYRTMVFLCEEQQRATRIPCAWCFDQAHHAMFHINNDSRLCACARCLN